MQQDTRTSKQIDGLAHLSYEELKEMWCTYFGKEPPAYNKVFLVNRLAQKQRQCATSSSVSRK